MNGGGQKRTGPAGRGTEEYICKDRRGQRTVSVKEVTGRDGAGQRRSMAHAGAEKGISRDRAEQGQGQGQSRERTGTERAQTGTETKGLHV